MVLALVLGLLAAVGASAPANARPTARLVNGGFDSGKAGWVTTPARRASLASTAAGRTARGLLVRKKSKRVVSVRTARPVALAGGKGSRVRATGWVRAARNGQKVTLVLRELRGKKVIRSSRSARTLRAGVWTPFATGLSRRAAGTAFEVRFTLGKGKGRVVLDQVALKRVATAASPRSGSQCFTGRGVPLCGPVLGSAYGSNTDPAGFESQISHKLGIRRTYYTASQVSSAVKTASNDLAHGRIPWISFKLPYSWAQMAAGSGDAWARDLATRMAALPGPVWLAFHHEPEGDGDIAVWRKMQERLGPIVRANAPNVAFTVVLTGWHQLYGAAEYRLASMWPHTKVDIAGFDVYNSLGVVKDGKLNTKGTDLAASYFKPIAAWARSEGVAWGLAETGYTDYASERLPAWIRQTFSAMRAHGGVAFTYFNTSLNSIAPWTLGTSTKVADYAAAQAQSPMLK